jgi:hypothetical protein
MPRGHPLIEHEHATFFIHAKDGRPVRLCVWRNKPFDDLEQNAILGGRSTTEQFPLPDFPTCLLAQAEVS